MADTLASPVRVGKPAVIALGILALATGTLQSVVTPALPLLQQELGISPASGALVTITLLITGAAITPIAGKLGDRYGGKRVLIRLMTVVSAGGLVSSMAPNLPVLLLGQTLQGAMVGALPLSYILVRENLSAGQSHLGIGVVTGAFVGGSPVGMLIAGPVAANLSWNWMFALPTIVLIAMTLAVHRLMPSDQPTNSHAGIDWAGMVLLSATLIALMLALSMVFNGAEPVLTGLIGMVAIALGIGWVMVERRASSPMVDLRLLTTSGTWRSCMITFGICVGSAMTLFLLPQLLEVSGDGYGFGANTSRIGLVMLPGMIAGAAGGPLGGIAAKHFGARAVAVGGILVEATTLLALTGMHSAVWHLALAKVLVGLAAGAGYTALVTGAATAVEHNTTGIVTSLVLLAKVVGSAVGGQVAGGLLTMGSSSAADVPAESGFVAGFLIAGVVTALSLLGVRSITKGVQE